MIKFTMMNNAECKNKLNAILSRLNGEQIKPVLDTEGAVLVIAGAGSGKTRVLVSRIVYLLVEKNVSPDNILAITFTNKAAEEMKERLRKIVGDEAGDLWVSTIHSMCVRILRRDIDKLGYDKNFTIYDETDKDKVLKRVFETLGYDAEALLKSAKSHISNAKNECLSPEEYKRTYADLRFIEEICNVYTEYERQLSHSNSLDFDDLLFKTYELFVKFPEIADYYSSKFRYIHIDEFQDTNKVQFAIAQRLSIKHGNIFVVGDDDQSIYGWRGAKIENILNFDDIYRGAKIYKLEQNYRSTKKILQLANCIIKNNSGRRDKELWTENSDGVKIETFVATDENSEAAYVAMQIKSLLARGEYTYKDFAVFMRVNALSRAFEQEFTKYDIPYRVYGGYRFFERKEIKDVLSYLKIVNNPYDDESFLRCVASPRRGIGDKTLKELREFCSANGYSLYEGIDYIDRTGIGASSKSKLCNFKLLLDDYSAFSRHNPPHLLIEHIIDSTGFVEQFSEKTEENTQKLLNIGELKNSAETFYKDNPGTGLSDYLNSVTLSSDTDSLDKDDAVTVATIHSAKGLEYKCVFVAGLDEKILPISRSSGSDDETEEERRLMYVAVTRAKERLYLTRAQSRYMYGGREYMTQSRFLKEAQSVLYPERVNFSTEKQDKFYGGSIYRDSSYENLSAGSYDGGSASGYSSAYAKTMLKGSKPVPNNKANISEYKPGCKVKHVKFGDGTVILVKGQGDNIIVDVAFKGVGVKSLSAKFAPMEILK